ncbi:MAG: HlyD family secretion protein [Arenicellales bacterium]
MTTETTDTVQDAERAGKRRRIRRILFLAGPLLLIIVGGGFYMTSGRYVSTDNAYVGQDKVVVSAQVAGSIIGVDVSENQSVDKGQVLFRLDPAPYQVALARARAGVEAARADIEKLQAAYRQQQETLVLDESNEAFADREYHRLDKLAGSKFASQEQLEQAKHNLDIAHQQIAITKQAIAQLLAQLGGRPGVPLQDQPVYQQAQAAVEQAALDLSHTTITAPFAGVVHKVPEPGQYVDSGGAVMALVSDANSWVDANFKETDLTYVRPGQPVRVEVDTYPGRTWRGVVKSISQATGAEFSVLPAQNATGNWVKVVQRIPVRIAVRAEDGAPPLRAGMSTNVRIDTGQYRHLPEFAQAMLLKWQPPAVYLAAAALAH